MEDFVTFEIAKKLKKKGFNEGCYKYYEDKELKWSNSPWLETQFNNYLPHITAAPTISQVLKWLRKEKNLHIAIDIWGRTWGYDIMELTSGNSLHWTAFADFSKCVSFQKEKRLGRDLYPLVSLRMGIELLKGMV